MLEVVVGIMEHTVEDLENKVHLIAHSGESTWVQIDVADGTLVPATTVIDMSAIGRIIAAHPHLSFEAHLMVASPEKYLKPLVDAGCKRIIAHVECIDPRVFIEDAKYESVEIGLAVDGPTELEQIEPYMDDLDFVLVMTIEAGASGQTLLPETVEKVKTLRELYPDIPIEVDGGINDQTAKIVFDAGATRVVSTSYVTNDPRSIPSHVKRLEGTN
jgi:ribulose-phosphate 3-epimerase